MYFNFFPVRVMCSCVQILLEQYCVVDSQPPISTRSNHESTPMENMTNVRPTAAAIRGIPRRDRKSKSRTVCGRG